MMGTIKQLLRPDWRYVDVPGGYEIHGELITNGITIHVRRSYNRVFVAVGEVPEHGSPEVTPQQAVQIIRQAARL